jgi:hypothetical protein
MMKPPSRPTRPKTRAATPSPFLLPLAGGVPIPGGIAAAGVGSGGIGVCGIGVEGVDPGGIDPGGGVAGV